MVGPLDSGLNATRRVVLVRHALSDADPNVDSRRWGIASDARDDCSRLANALPGVGSVVYASSERKAIETARLLAERTGAEVRIDERFGEVRRPYTWDDDYRSIAVTYLREGRDEWEPRAGVVARFTSAIVDAARSEPDVPLIVVNHGLAMSLYLASVADIDVVTFWTALTFPDAWALDPGERELVRLFSGGRPAPDA